jgi:hypothetical protein
MLGKALRALDHAIPRAFALPEPIREYFEGVKTGEEGEYTEYGQPRTHNSAPKMNRAGFIEEPNYKEPRDAKGKLNLCKRCGLGANGRDLVPCDYCDAKWHLDCIDPPLAVPPRRRAGDKPSASWRCPLHVEHDMVSLSRQIEAAPGDLGGRPRLRKPKNAIPIDVDFPRGFRNNGIIEIDLAPDAPNIMELDMKGKVYRVPEQAIRLDFIDRVKKSWYEDKTFPDTANGRRPPRFIKRDYHSKDATILHAPTHTTITIKEPQFHTGAQAISIVENARANAEMRRKTLPEQQAVLNLASMASVEDGRVYAEALTELTNTLIAEAPEQVAESQIRDEKAQLERLQELVSRRLRILDGREGPPLPAVPDARQNHITKYMKQTDAGDGANSAANGTASRALREIQPMPQPIPSASSGTQLQSYGFDAAQNLSNGQTTYYSQQQSGYGAPPPPFSGQSAYPFPPAAQSSSPGDWQMPQPQSASAYAPWPQPAYSPGQSPFGQPPQVSYERDYRGSTTSPQTGVLPEASPTAATPYLESSTIVAHQPGFVSALPPASPSKSIPMQRLSPSMTEKDVLGSSKDGAAPVQPVNAAVNALQNVEALNTACPSTDDVVNSEFVQTNTAASTSNSLKQPVVDPALYGTQNVGSSTPSAEQSQQKTVPDEDVEMDMGEAGLSSADIEDTGVKREESATLSMPALVTNGEVTNEKFVDGPSPSMDARSMTELSQGPVVAKGWSAVNSGVTADSSDASVQNPHSGAVGDASTTGV